MDNNKVVILGTAHGINTPGKCSPDKKFREYKFSREVINILKPKLETLGLTVYIDIPQDEVPRPAGSELAMIKITYVIYHRSGPLVRRQRLLLFLPQFCRLVATPY